jgi:hypothetical protein
MLGKTLVMRYSTPDNDPPVVLRQTSQNVLSGGCEGVRNEIRRLPSIHRITHS